VNSLSHNNSTPLHDAAFFGRVGAVDILLAAGAKVNAKNDKGQTPRDLAIKKKGSSWEHFRILELLDEHDTDSENANTQNMHEGSSREDFIRFVELSKQGLVVIDYYAGWCSHCVNFEPYWKKLADRYPTVSFCRLICADRSQRSTEGQRIASQLGVSSYPTFHLFRNSEQLGDFSGGGQGGYDRLDSEISTAMEVMGGRQMQRTASLARRPTNQQRRDLDDDLDDELLSQMYSIFGGGMRGPGGPRIYRG